MEEGDFGDKDWFDGPGVSGEGDGVVARSGVEKEVGEAVFGVLAVEED